MQNNLRRIRATHGITQEQLGEVSGVHQSVISSVELTGRRPNVDTALRLAHGLSRLTGQCYRVEDLFSLEPDLAGTER